MTCIKIPPVYNIEEFVTYDIDRISSSLLNALIVPRPVAFITSKGKDGIVNAAPFSYFNIVCDDPPIVSISINRYPGGYHKDTAHNILVLKEFVINICSSDLAQIITITAYDFPSDVSEVEVAKLSLLPSQKISVPRIANTFIQMECVLSQVIKVGKTSTELFLGEIVKIHIHQDILTSKGMIDFKKLDPLTRLGGLTFGKVTHFFEVLRVCR